MSFPEAWDDLLRAQAYSHRCDPPTVVETHISWVILTGQFAYKLKKPVRFPFVDFSTLALREHFCREELRCNRPFAPSLYLDVVKVVRDDGRLRMDGAGEAVEWAVKMRQFAPEAQLDRLLERGELTAAMLEAFGATLASQHRGLPARRLAADELEARVLAPARDNFDDVESLDWSDAHRHLLARGRAASETLARRLTPVLVRRLESGRIRECHGDLHLSNLVLLDSGVTAFDCLEFNPNLRWIDPVSDVAFLFMDCLVRGRADLAYAFLDGYLDASGDYDGVRLLPFYAAYRSMVRAKVAALRHDQAAAAQAAAAQAAAAQAAAAQPGALRARFLQHAEWAVAWLERPPGRLVLTCGLSGSGKSTLARRLAPRMPAVRVRSDVARKALAGLTPRDPAGAAVGEGLYRAEQTDAVYRWLETVAEDLLRAGEHVIVDATFLLPERRRPFLELAGRLGSVVTLLHCDAPAAVLETRVAARARAGADPSDADLAVLARQREAFVPPRQVLRVDTSAPLEERALDELAATLAGR